MKLPDNYKENLLKAMEASSEERHREEVTRYKSRTKTTLIVVAVFVVILIVALIAG